MNFSENTQDKWAKELDVIDKDLMGIEFESVGIIGKRDTDDKYKDFDRMLDMIDIHQRVFLNQEGDI